MKELKYKQGGLVHTYTHVKMFTGKKDKDGVPIVEGDVVEVDLNNGKFWVVKWDEDSAGFVLGTMINNKCAGGSNTPVRAYRLNCRRKITIITSNSKYYCPLHGGLVGCTKEKCEYNGSIPDCYKKLGKGNIC